MANWKYTIDITPEWGQTDNDQDTYPITKLIDVIIERFRILPLALVDEVAPYMMELRELQLQALAFEDDVDADEFDEVWNKIYDWADARLVWIKFS